MADTKSDDADPALDPSGLDETTLSRGELHHSLMWLFGIIATIEFAIILKLLLEGGR